MSVARSPEQKPRRTVFGVIVLFLAATGVIALQITLPWGSWWIYRNRDARVDASGQIGSDGALFWRRRFRFEEFLSPAGSAERRRWMAVSGTVCDNAVVLLLKLHDRSSESQTVPTEVLRIPLRGGKVTRSAASPETLFVLSDGRTLWQLPGSDRQPFLKPFVRNGVPTIIAETPNVAEWIVPEFYGYAEERWQPTGEFPLIPRHYLHSGLICFTTDERTNLLLDVFDQEIWYRNGIETATAFELQGFYERYQQRVHEYTAERLYATGWKFASIVPTPAAFHAGRHRFFFEGDVPASLQPVEIAARRNDKRGFLWYRHSIDHDREPQFIPAPNPWTAWEFTPTSTGSWDDVAFLISSMDGNTYLAGYNQVDGRAHVYRCENQQLNLVVQHSSPLIWLASLDASLLFALAVALPTALWGGFACRWQRRAGPRDFTTSLKTAVLASVGRRAAARLIDLSLAVPFLLLAFVCHPDIIGWWRRVATEDLRGLFGTFQWSSRAQFLPQFTAYSRSLFEDAVATPYVKSFLLLGVAIIVVQIVCQARTGQTLGKRLLGVRVLRTSLQPCGLARSVLREIWLAADSLLLLSWVPGVISILLTDRSQRIGDKMADTIVVRELPA